MNEYAGEGFSGLCLALCPSTVTFLLSLRKILEGDHLNPLLGITSPHSGHRVLSHGPHKLVRGGLVRTQFSGFGSDHKCVFTPFHAPDLPNNLFMMCQNSGLKDCLTSRILP